MVARVLLCATQRTMRRDRVMRQRHMIGLSLVFGPESRLNREGSIQILH